MKAEAKQELIKSDAIGNQIVNYIFKHEFRVKGQKLECVKGANMKDAFSMFSPFEIVQIWCNRKNIECDLYNEIVLYKLNIVCMYYSWFFNEYK